LNVTAHRRIERRDASPNSRFSQVEFWRIALDESHRIARSRSHLTATCAALRAARRWCLTGTPWQREMKETLGQARLVSCRASL
jgi:E3 ubiquitin-protein ligase SHPRH